MKIGLIAELLRKPFYECIEYAAKIGADFYGKDAMETVRFAENAVK